jgi:hypothetical protein
MALARVSLMKKMRTHRSNEPAHLHRPRLDPGGLPEGRGPCHRGDDVPDVRSDSHELRPAIQAAAAVEYPDDCGDSNRSHLG